MFLKALIEKISLFFQPKWSWEVIVVILCTLLVFCAGIYKIEEVSITNDEATTIFIANHDDVNAVIRSERDTYPPFPLYYILVHFFLRLHPASQIFMVRFFSLLFGILSVPLFYIFLRRVAPSYNPLPAVALFSVSELLVYFSREGRCFSLILFLSILSGLAVVKILKHNNFKSWFVYLLASLSLIYTHYFTAFFLFSQTLFIVILCLADKKIVQIRNCFITVFIMAIIVFPLYPDVIKNAVGHRELLAGTDYGVGYLKHIILTFTCEWRKLQLIYITLYLLGLWRCFIHDKKLFLLNLFLFSIPLLVAPAFEVSGDVDYLRVKYVIYVLPYFLIPVSIGFLYIYEITALKLRRKILLNSAAIVFILTIMSVMITDLKLYTISNYFNNKTHANWKLASHFLDFSVKSEDGIGFYPNYTQKIYHVYSTTDADTFFFGSSHWRPKTDRYRFQSVNIDKLNNNMYESIFKKYRRFWMVTMRGYEHRGYENIRSYFLKHFQEREIYCIDRVKIFMYQRRL